MKEIQRFLRHCWLSLDKWAKYKNHRNQLSTTIKDSSQ